MHEPITFFLLTCPIAPGFASGCFHGATTHAAEANESDVLRSSKSAANHCVGNSGLKAKTKGVARCGSEGTMLLLG